MPYRNVHLPEATSTTHLRAAAATRALKRKGLSVHVLERDAQDVRKLLEWLPAAQTRRDRRAIIARARDLLAEIEFAIQRIAEVE